MTTAISSATTAMPVSRPDNDGDNDAKAPTATASAAEKTPSAATASKGAQVNTYA